MKQFNTLTTLIFDFGGVIINLDLAKCIQNLKTLGIGEADKYLSNFEQKDFFLQCEKGQIGTPEFRNEIRKLCSKTLSDKEIDDAWCSFLCDIPAEKLEILTQLKKKYRILLLSNTNPLHIHVSGSGELSKLGKTYDDFFDKCFFSYEMGMAKPDAEIFEAVLTDAGVEAGECLFLDDGEKNIEAASKLGFQTRLVTADEDLSFLLKLQDSM